MNNTLSNKEVFELFFDVKLNFYPQQLVKCIFHPDKTPSLAININKGVYYCFSCGEKGNVQTIQKFLSEGGNE